MDIVARFQDLVAQVPDYLQPVIVASPAPCPS